MTVDASSTRVRTVLLHRKHRGPSVWWHNAVVLPIGPALDGEALANLLHLGQCASSLGVDAVHVELSTADVVRDRRLALFVASTHEHSLKVLVTLPGAAIPVDASTLDVMEGVTTLLGRIRACRAAGADGVDLAEIPDPASIATPDGQARYAQRFTDLVQVLLAEVSGEDDSPILTASSATTSVDVLRHQLEDNWFHHLRDTFLNHTAWDGPSIARTLRQAYELRDPIGQVTAWSWSASENDAAASPQTGYDDNARLLASLALPGSVYLASGIPVAQCSPLEAQASALGGGTTRVAMLREATRLRRERDMGTGSLAIVDGLEWAPDGVLVMIVSGIMVVLNTTSTDIEVPSQHLPLLTSAAPRHRSAVSFTLPAHSCGWFETARVQAAPTPFDYA
ncbi:hypothetical protein [Schaalia suimastitidis]|uniref:hypothetical protein n=1 Tax=Schaalia suimastitidis TaxID=121163 RepID=UPI00047C9D13|nr:hypothetical protein [Schaalia suimastitidis]